VPGQFQGRPDGLLPGAENGPPPGDRERADDLQAVARLGLQILRRHRRRRARLVGDHADQPAGLQAPAQLNACALGFANVILRGGRGSVLYRVGSQLRRNNDGVLDQWFQLPLVQGGHGKLAGGPGRPGHGGQREAVAPPRSWWRGSGGSWPLGGVAIVCGARGTRRTSLVHGSTTEPEVWARAPLGQRISYDATSDVQMQVHVHRTTQPLIGTRATAPGESPRFQVDGGGKTRSRPACCRRKR